jgi:hypothetical protein
VPCGCCGEGVVAGGRQQASDISIGQRGLCSL